MASETGTGTMSGFGGRAAKTDAPGTLVLLYAAGFAAIPPAIAVGDALVLGREPPPGEGGLRLEESGVSRVHARVERRSGGFRVVDLGSKNGIIVNGRFVREVDLRHLDEVRIGDALFKFVAEPAEAYAPYRIDGELGDGAAETDPAVVGGHQMRAIVRELARVSKAPLSVLVLGETGTGKEVVARAIHRLSARRGPFAALNCAAIPANLVESELFGFRRGAFTGADRDHVGVVRAAHGGTLLLDEIGDMPLEVQAKLLRLLETREVVPLGETTASQVDVRIVCATHRDLQSLVDAGKFRGDLFARIQGYTVVLPPLRARKEDLLQLVRHIARAGGRPDIEVSFRFMVNVCQHRWPYNVRELASALQRAMTVAEGTVLEDHHLPQSVREAMRTYGEPPSEVATPAASAEPLPSKRTPTDAELRLALAETHGNLTEVARRFGKDRTQIRRWLRLYGIDPDAYRA